MSESLAVRVADRLEIQPEQTDRVLRTLAQLIKKQSARDGRVRVPGLGVFEQTAEALHFEPDHALADAVNERYAGLEAVHLSKVEEAAPYDAAVELDAPPTPEAVATPPEPAPEGVGVTEQEDLEEPVAEEEPTAEEEPADEEEPTAEEEPADEITSAAFPGLPHDDADYEDPDLSEAAAYEELERIGSAPEEEAAFEEQDPSAWAPPVASWTGDTLDTPTPVPAEDAPEDLEPASSAAGIPVEEAPPQATDLPPRPPRMRPPPQAQKRRSVLPWILLVFFLSVIAASAYYLLNLRNQPTPATDTPVATDAAPPPDEGAAPATGETGSAEDAGAPEATTPPEQAPETATPTQAAQPTPEGRIDRAVGGYTLVVASTTRRQVAEAEAERFRQRLSGRSIPVDVLQGTTDGVTRYRVAVGQVPSTAEAVALKERLGDNLPQAAWVTRILPNS